MNNKPLRDYAKQQDVKMWQLADTLGIAESTLCRRLRYELSDEDLLSYKQAIDHTRLREELSK